MSNHSNEKGMRLLLAGALLAGSCFASAQVYRWTDGEDKTHYTDTPPPPSARQVPLRARIDNVQSGETAEPYALQMARKNAPVKLYSTSGCDPCDQARKLLNARGVPFAEVSVGDPSSIADLKAAVGSTSLPAIVVGGIVQKGFEEGLYHRTLDAAGYPKQGVLPPRNQGAPKPEEPDAQPQPEETAAVRGPYAPRR